MNAGAVTIEKVQTDRLHTSCDVGALKRAAKLGSQAIRSQVMTWIAPTSISATTSATVKFRVNARVFISTKSYHVSNRLTSAQSREYHQR